MATNLIKLQLWRIWIFIFIMLLHIYLIYTSIHDYLQLKILTTNLAFGGNWKTGPMNFQLSCLLCSITLLPIILLSSIIVTDNLANDGHVLGKDIDNNHFIFDSDEKGHLIRIDIGKSHSNKNMLFCGTQATLKQQFLPLSIFLQIVSGFCYLLPLPFIEAQKIHHGALKANHLWHTDLDFMIDPDKEHEDFTYQQRWNFQLPMRAAYFNMIFCLCQLTFSYPSVFWRTNRKFSFLFCIILIMLSLHILVDYSSTSILIRLAINQEFISAPLRPKISPIIISLISVLGSLILIVTQITLFNYGLNQYFTSLARHRQNLRLQYKIEQSKKQSDESSNVSSETLDINDNASSDAQECDFHFNKYINHLVAIIFGFAGMSTKTSLFLHNAIICSKTGDRLMYLNIAIAVVFSAFWLILWFGLSLHNTWQFKVVFQTQESQRMNMNNIISVREVSSSTLPTATTNLPVSGAIFADHSSPVYATCTPSGLTLVRRTFTPNLMKKSFDSCDETDLSSCYNYVLLHNANNSKRMPSPANSSAANLESIIRQGLVKTKTTNSPFLNTECPQIINVDDAFGSENSFGSNFSRSLTVQDKNRYTLANQESSDSSLRHFVNRYYSMEHNNNRKDQRMNIGRSPLLSYQFSTESSPSESQSRRTILDPLTTRVSFKNEISIVEPDMMAHRLELDSKTDFNDQKNFELTDLNPSMDKMRTVLVRSDSRQMDSINTNVHFNAASPTMNQNGFKDNTFIIVEKPINPNVAISVGKLDNGTEEMPQIGLNYVSMNSFDENISEDDRLCSQV